MFLGSFAQTIICYSTFLAEVVTDIECAGVLPSSVDRGMRRVIVR